MTKELKGLAAAFGFLTILPIPWRQSGRYQDLSRSLKYFPVVGLFVGLFAAFFDAALGALTKAPIFTGAAAVIALAAVSKALHLDGLADTFDGFLSSKPRERILEIMKDSRIGAMGALAVFSVLLLKFAALQSLPPEVRRQTLFLMPLAGRSSIIFQMRFLSYARDDRGLAAVFKNQCGPFHAIFAFSVLAAAGWSALEWTGIVAACITFAATLLFSLYCRGKIGGFTGDTLGAGCEIAELIAAVAVLACGGECAFF